MRGVWLAVAVALLLAPMVTALGVVQQGSFYEYRYTLTYDERSVEGKVRVTVLEAVGEGSIRLRLEATFNDGVLTLEKNVPGSAFTVPTLRLPESGSFSYSREGWSFSVSVVKTGSGSRTVGGRTYETEVYSVTVVSASRNASFSASGTVELIAGSGAIYALDVTATGGSSKGVRFTAQLVDANFDLTQVGGSGRAGDAAALASLTPSLLSPGASEWSGWMGTMGLLAGQQPTSPAQTPRSPQASAPDDSTLRLVAVTAVGLAAMGSVAALGLLRRPRRSPAPVEKPHYV